MNHQPSGRPAGRAGPSHIAVLSGVGDQLHQKIYLSHPADKRTTLASAQRRCRAALRGIALLLMTLSMVLTGCGDWQTDKPYTPADGVNFDVGVVRVRNLMLLSKKAGSGVVSASIVSDGPDVLISVAGTPITPDNSPGRPLEVNMAGPVPVDQNLIVLTDRAWITVRSPDLQPGLTARLTLKFRQAGEDTVTVPVVDAHQLAYATISPTPSPTQASTSDEPNGSS